MKVRVKYSKKQKGRKEESERKSKKGRVRKKE
jgi:hypothetical protein